MCRLIPILLVLASVILGQGASAQTRLRDPDAPYATTRPDRRPVTVRPLPRRVEVPAVINLGYGRAAALLREKGLVPVANRTDGVVRAQSEPAGKMVLRGTRVSLRVVPRRAPSPPPPQPTPPSPSPPREPSIREVEVPAVIDLGYGRAAAILREKGLVPVANRRDGIVRAQSEPAGKMVPRGTRVSLRVVPPRAPSPPPPQPTPPSPSPPREPGINRVEVPPLKNLTLAGAEQRLAGRRLQLGEVVRRRTPGVRRGVIIGQEPPPGTLVRVRTKVHVELAVPNGETPPPPSTPPYGLLLLIISGVGGAAYLLYKIHTRSKTHPPPPKPRFEARAGEATQKIVADRAIVETALRLKVVKDRGKQELEAGEAIIPGKDEGHD